MIVGVIPFTTVPAAATLSLSELQAKFPDGKYWNHSSGGRSNNNPNGWTDTPCSCHGRSACVSDKYGDCRCNYFDGGVQCFGFAYKLAYDAYGSYASGWSSGNMSSLKAGDVIRYKNDGHSIWVTAVNGDTITYADCNSDTYGNTCIIRWNKTISKSTVSKTLSWIKSAPYELSGSSSPSYYVDTSYVTPFYATVNSSSDVQAYDSVNGNESGVLWPNELCSIVEVYTNGWCKLIDSLDKIKFVSVSAFNLNTVDTRYLPNFKAKVNSDSDVQAYDAVNGSTSGVLWPDEECTILEVYTSGWCKLIDSVDKIKFVTTKVFDLTYALPCNLGDDFTAPLLNNNHWKIIENKDGIVQTANETGFANQLWRFVRQSDGSYRIYSCLDGTCLDVTGASNWEGAKVGTYSSNDTDAQRWYIYEEAGGYILKAKCTDCVLDLPDNNPTNGNQLHMWTKTGTGAQIWAIYTGDECKLKGTTLSVNTGTSTTDTVFYWDNTYGETGYSLKIWNGTYWEGNPCYVAPNAISGHTVTLPAGTYEAYVDVYNFFEYKMSNVVEFTVTKGSYTIKFNANGGTCDTSSMTVEDGSNCSALPKPTKAGYTFLGWSTDSAASTPEYLSGATFTVDGDTTLYAVWKEGCEDGAHDHSIESTVSPDCINGGYTVHSCSLCGNTYTDSFTDALGHDYVEGICTRCDEADPNYTSGDLNGDNSVNISDLFMMKSFLAGHAELTEAQSASADLNGDGKINISDFYQMKRYLTSGELSTDN